MYALCVPVTKLFPHQLLDSQLCTPTRPACHSRDPRGFLVQPGVVVPVPQIPSAVCKSGGQPGNSKPHHPGKHCQALPHHECVRWHPGTCALPLYFALPCSMSSGTFMCWCFAAVSDACEHARMHARMRMYAQHVVGSKGGQTGSTSSSFALMPFSLCVTACKGMW